MKKYKYGLTEDIVNWGIKRGVVTPEEIETYNEYDAATLIDCYNIHNNKKCFIYSRMVESSSGGKMLDTVTGYLHEDYDTAKAREYNEKNDLMNQEI